MGENSKIEWCDHTFNPWIGCTEVSPACDHCYARTMMQDRYGKVQWGNHPRVRTSASNWQQPLRWNAAARRDGVRRRVFCASLADVFDNQALDEWRADLWSLIYKTPHLDWLLLTKRPQNILTMLPPDWMRRADDGHWAPRPNVWLGTTVENSEEAGRRLKCLRDVPVAVRFLSCEPLLGDILLYLGGIDWVICGGESGPGARPMHPDWARSLRDQCAAAGVPFFFKQWGDWIDADHWLDVIERAHSRIMHQGRPWQPSRPLNFADAAIVADVTGRAGKLQHNSDGTTMIRVGKQAAGALLDGIEHKAFPA